MRCVYLARPATLFREPRRVALTPTGFEELESGTGTRKSAKE